MKTFLGLLLISVGAAGLIGMKGLGDADQAFGCAVILVVFVALLALMMQLYPN